MGSLQIGGGLGDEYMRAPGLSVGGGGKGGSSFIAGLLDILGIQRQVAKGPKAPKGDKSKTQVSPERIPGEKKAKKGNDSSGAQIVSATGGAPGFPPMMGAQTSAPAKAPPPRLSILDDAQEAFRPMTPMATKFGFGLNFLSGTQR